MILIVEYRLTNCKLKVILNGEIVVITTLLKKSGGCQ
jgi:hypothetical protein